MPNMHISGSAVSSEFFKPAFHFLADSKCRRNCPARPDELWVEAGIRRCLGLFQSGRDFLQDLADRHDVEILSTTKYATGHLSSLDLRSHCMTHLCVAD